MRILLFLIFSVFYLYAQPGERLAALVDSYKSGPELKQASWSLYAVNLGTNEVLLSLNPELKLAPASNLKVLTSAAAITYFGPEHRFSTIVGYSGRIADEILEGDLIILGGGDPTFCSERIPGSPGLKEILSRIKNQVDKEGIKYIRGGITVDVSFFEDYVIPDYWPWIDIGNYYGAGVSALCVNENYYTLKFQPGKKEGDPVLILGTDPELRNTTIINEVRTGSAGSGDNAYIYFIPINNSLVVKGTVPAGEDGFSIKGNLANPAHFFAALVEKALFDAGIKTGKPFSVTDKRTDELTKILEFTSPPLIEIIKVINKKSNNLYTEQLLSLLAQKRGGRGGHKAGILGLYEFLRENKIFNDGISLYDGSGLSRNNCITTKTFAGVLGFMAKSPHFQLYFDSLPVAGDENDPGGFKKFGKGTPLERKLFVKSGLINGVRAFSGYLLNKKNEMIAFSFIANNFQGTSQKIDDIHKDLLMGLTD